MHVNRLCRAGQAVYSYSPLESPRHTRLVHLQPGSHHDSVECKLVHVDLDIEPEYECISYVWGDTEERQDVQCNGVTVSITASLYAALVRVRLEDKPRVIWADELSIDQSNNDERSVQVMLMHDIYSNCQRCLCWTGPGTASSDQAFSLIREVVRQTCEVENAKTPADVFYSRNKQFMGPGPELENLPKSDQPEWRAIGEFFSRPYFSRLWIIQEVMAPRDVLVLCGRDELSYEHIGVCARWIVLNELRGSPISKDSDGFTNLGFFHASLCRRDFQNTSHPPLDALDFGRTFGCTDPRDHLYGLLAYPSVREAFSDIQPDYSISVAKLYTNMAVHLITSAGRIHVIEFVENEDVNPLGLPSWVPNWTKQLAMHLPDFKAGGPTCDLRLADMGYDIGFDHGFDPRTASHKVAIRVPGLIFDKISWVGDPGIQNATEEAFLPVSEPGIRTMIESRAQLPNGKNLFSSYVSSLTIGRDWRGEPLRTSIRGAIQQHKYDFTAYLLSKFPELRNKYGPDRELVYQGLSFKPNKDISPALVKLAKKGDAKRFDRALRLRLAWRFPMIYTKKGYLGIADAPKAELKIKPGDVIAVVFTARCCFILRPERGYYRLMGKCYVHGIMWGEAMDMLEEGLLEETMFELR